MSIVPSVDGRHLPRTLLAYAVGLAVFLLVPPTIKATVGPPEAFTGQELLDLFTPVVVLPIAWLVLTATGPVSRSTAAVFVAIAGLWAGGQGIHLAANAIGDAFAVGPARDAFYATVAGDLDHFLDEVLGHWTWHVAWVGLSVLMLLVAGGGAGVGRSGASAPTLAGAIHGAVFFFVTTEGGTVALGIPASAVLLVWAGRDRLLGSRHPVIVFLVASSLVTLLAYVIWAVRFGWPLVEPCTLLHC
jgi:uncharacterized membrane protein (UPF0136 family)